MSTSQTDYRNPALAAHERADLLAREMTTLEKAWQLASVPVWWIATADGSTPPQFDRMMARAPGHTANFATDSPRDTADLVGRMQRAVVEGTRWGIPLLVHAEALNGFLGGGHMVFPTSVGLAATWSPKLVERMAEVIREQMRRVGVRQALSPNMDIAVDPRWGRTHETYGEDPYLAGAFSVAYTRGLQGSDLRSGVIATAKHFVGYGKPEGGVNLSSVFLGARMLRDVYAFPFEAAIQVAGLASVMNSYSDVDGVPCAASPEILTDLLRDTLGFDGFTTADYTSHDHMVDRQGAAPDFAAAARLAIAAGLDTENPMPAAYGDVLAAEVEGGAVPAEHLERSVRRVLTAKFALGLFENPYPAETIDVSAVAGEGRELSAELARRQVVLLKNDGLLPLPANQKRIAVVGPHADAAGLQFPTYTFPAFREMTLFMSGGGLGNMVGVDPGMATFNSTLFPDITNDTLVRRDYGATALGEAIGASATHVTIEPATTLLEELDGGIERAVAAAKDADVVVLALGGASLWFRGERTEGEGSDTADIALPAVQTRLAEAVAATGKPIVVVLTQGRAYALPPVVQDAAAIVVTSYGGPFGPQGVADVLFGRVNPSGHLPYTIPAHSGQLPVYHHQPRGSQRRQGLPPGVANLYLDMPAEPQYDFGHGLSYTTFEIAGLDVTPRIDTAGAATITSTVRNTGDRAGTALVQMYVRVNTTGVVRPAQQLAGFARVDLAAGEEKQVIFTLDATQLVYTNLAREFAVEPAPVDVWLGLSSADRAAAGRFEVTGEPRVLTAAERVFFAEVEVS